MGSVPASCDYLHLSDLYIASGAPTSTSSQGRNPHLSLVCNTSSLEYFPVWTMSNRNLPALLLPSLTEEKPAEKGGGDENFLVREMQKTPHLRNPRVLFSLGPKDSCGFSCGSAAAKFKVKLWDRLWTSLFRRKTDWISFISPIHNSLSQPWEEVQIQACAAHPAFWHCTYEKLQFPSCSGSCNEWVWLSAGTCIIKWLNWLSLFSPLWTSSCAPSPFCVLFVKSCDRPGDLWPVHHCVRS